MKLTLTSTHWYEITYPDGEKLIFQFLDTTANGTIKCKLCDESITTEIFNKPYTEVIEYGKECPCE